MGDGHSRLKQTKVRTELKRLQHAEIFVSIQTSAGLIFKSLPDGKKPPTSGLFKHTDVLPSAFIEQRLPDSHS